MSQRNAAAFVEELHKNGFTDARIVNGKKMTRVVYGSYSTENEAYNELRSCRRSNFFKEAWVIKF